MYDKAEKKVKKKISGKGKQGYIDRKDESIAMRIKKARTKKQLKDSRDESFGRWGSKAKKSGKIDKSGNGKKKQCKICDVFITNSHWDRHLKSKGHKSKK